uniref:Kinesin-like protein n=1 Tax=Terrapene triunguis TaxID=2587831 RepID=A0A674IUN3_9SAUR
MVKQTIQIYARVKPLARRQQAGIYSVGEDEKSASSLEIIVPRDLADGFVNNKRESYKFKFQKIFDQEAKQDAVFESIAKPVAECALAGYNGTIFAYGQTGSGKTFTITGGAERYSDRGIIPRTLSYIFQQLKKDSSKVYTTHVSYLEIYNECGYDLLDPRHEASRLEDLPKVTIMEDPDQNIHLKNLSLQQATNEEEALNLLFLGDTNRMIAETPMNQASTRSHCIFTIHISSKEPGSATIRHSKLHLVDLAGSERVAKTGVGGQLLTEAKYINLSLHYLEQVIIALAEKHRSHIPYRNSMMTSVLRDSLGGNCMTTMIATLSLDKRNIDESISTCRFAQRVALIKNEAVLNEEIDPRLMIIQLKKVIQELKDELAMVTGEQRTEELTQEELLQLDEIIKTFLEDPDPESMLDVGADMRKIKHCFNYIKVYSVHLQRSAESPKNELEILEDTRERELKNILVSMLKKEKKKAQDALFQLNAGSSGLAVSESSLSISLEEGQRPSACVNVKDTQEFSSSVHRSAFLPRRTGSGGEMSLGRQEAFEIFKRDYVDSVTIEDNKQLLKQSPSEELNESDPVEERFRAQIEEEKKSYKTMFNRLKGLKIEIEHLQLLMEKAKVKLQKDFEVWWSEEASNLQVSACLLQQYPWLQHITKDTFFAHSSRFFSSELRSSERRARRAISPGHCNNGETLSGQMEPINACRLLTPRSSSSSIPLTGDSQTDADILAFIKARQNLLQKKGKPC